jgi:hypothetical protein
MLEVTQGGQRALSPSTLAYVRDVLIHLTRESLPPEYRTAARRSASAPVFAIQQSPPQLQPDTNTPRHSALLAISHPGAPSGVDVSKTTRVTPP